MVTTSTDLESNGQGMTSKLETSVQMRADVSRLNARVIRELQANVTNMTGPFSSMRQIPIYADQIVAHFLDFIDGRLPANEFSTQLHYWVARGFGPEGAFAAMDALYQAGTAYNDAALQPVLDDYRHRFSVGYEVARRVEILGEHERMQRSLYKALEKQIASEREVREALLRRQWQLETAADLARVTSSLRDINDLLATACRHLQERLNLVFVGAYLLDEFRQRAILRASSGDAGRDLQEEGYQVALDEDTPFRSALNESRIVFLKQGFESDHARARLLQPVTPAAAIVPLNAHGTILGFWAAYSGDEKALTPQDAAVLQLIGDNLAYSIENAGLFAEAQANLEELQRAQRTYLREAWTGQDIVQELVYSQKQDEFASLDGDAASLSLVARNGDSHSTMSVPIRLRGEVIGTVDLVDVTQSRTWSQEEQALASGVVEQMAMAVENARLFDQAQQRAEELSAINEITNVISEQLELESLFDQVHKQVQRVMPTDAFFVMLYDDVAEMATYPYIFDDGRRHPDTGSRVSPRGHLRQVLDTGKGILENRTPERIAAIAARENRSDAVGNVSKVSASLLYAPLRRGDRIVGILSAQSYALNAYHERDLELLEGIGVHVAVALQNARLFEATQKREQETGIINELARELSGELDQERLFGKVYPYLKRLLPTDAFIVWFYDDATQTATRPVLYDLDVKYPPQLQPQPLTARMETILKTNAPLAVNLTRQEWEAERAKSYDVFGSNEASASLLYAPLRVAERIRGFISVQSYQFNAYEEPQVALLTAVANHVATALENAQLFAETTQALSNTQILYLAAQRFAAAGSTEDLYRAALEGIAGTPHIDTASLVLATPTPTFPPRSTTMVAGWTRERGSFVQGENIGVPVSWEDLQVLHALNPNARETLVFASLDDERIDPKSRTFLRSQQMNSFALLPVATADSWFGFMVINALGELPLRADSLQLPQGVANQLALALENRRLFGQSEAALAETQMLYEVAVELSRVKTLDWLLMAGVGIGYAEGASESRLFVLDKDAEDNTWARLAAVWAADDKPTLAKGVNYRLYDSELGRYFLSNPDTLHFISDAKTDPRLDEGSRQQLITINAIASVIMPLGSGGLPHAVVHMTWNAPHEFSERDERMYRSLSSQMTLALDNRMLFEETEAALQETQRLYNIGARLNQVTSLEDLVRIAAQPAFEQGAGSAQLLLMDYQDGDQPVAANVIVSLVTPGEPAELSPYTHFPIAEFGLGQAMLANPRELVMLENVATSTLLDEQTRQVLLASHDQAVVMLPLTVESRVLGAIAIGWDQPRTFSAQERRLYQSLSSELALVLNNRLLFEQTQAALEETRTLYEISARLNASNSLQEALEAAAAKALESGAHLAALFAMNVDANNTPRTMTLQATTGPAVKQSIQPGTTLPIVGSPFSNAWTEDPSQPVFVEDVESDPRLTDTERGNFQRSRVKSTAILPLYMSGRWAGMLGLNWAQPHTFSDQEKRLYRSIMSQAATVLDNRRLFEQTQEALAETQTLYEISARLNASSSIQEALEAAAGPAIVQGAYTASLLRLFTDADGMPNEMELAALWPRNVELPIPLGTRFASEYLAGDTSWIDNPYEPALIENVNTDPRVNEFGRASYASTGIQSTALLPMKIGDRWVGVLNFNWKEPRTFTQRDTRMYRSLMAQASTVLDNRSLFEQTQNALALTENLYNASQRLSTADTLQEMVAGVAESVNIPAINRAVLLILERDARGELDSMFVGANWSNGVGNPPTPVGTRYPRAMFQAIPIVLSPTVMFFDDVPNEARLDPSSRMVFERQEILSVALMPLWVGSEQRGALLLETQELHKFTEEESRALVSLAPQLAIAIENRRLFEATQTALAQTQTALSQVQEAQDRLNLQYQTANILARSNSFEQAAPELLETVCRALSWRLGEYWSIDEASNRLVLTHLWSEPIESLQEFAADSYGLSFAAGEGLSGRTWQEGRPIWVPNVNEDPAFRQVDKAKAAGLVSALAFPLQSETRQFGVTVFFTDYALLLDDNLMATMVSVSSQIGQYLERRRAEEAVRQQNTYLTALHDTTLGLMRRLDLDELLQNIITRAGELVGTEHGYVHLIEPSGAELRMRVGIGIYQDFVGTRVKPGQGLAGTVWQNEEPIIVDDYRYWQGRLPMVDRDVLRAVAGVPLKSGTQTVGVLGLASLEEGRKFGAAQVEALDRFAQLAAVALDNAQLYNATQSALEQTQRLAQREKASAEIADKLYAASDVQDVLRTAAEELRRSTKSKRAVVRLNLNLNLNDSVVPENGKPESNGNLVPKE